MKDRYPVGPGGNPPVPGTRELVVVDGGNRNAVKVHRGLYGRNRKHDHSAGYESPFDRFPFAMDRVHQRGRMFEEQRDENA